MCSQYNLLSDFYDLPYKCYVKFSLKHPSIAVPYCLCDLMIGLLEVCLLSVNVFCICKLHHLSFFTNDTQSGSWKLTRQAVALPATFHPVGGGHKVAPPAISAPT